MLSATITGATEQELRFIAGLDYGQGWERHLQSLRSLIFERDGVIAEGEHWYPHEVVELGSHALKPGHEREFAICTLLVIEAVRNGSDRSTDLATKLDHRARDYDALPHELRDEIIDAYHAAGC